MINPTVTNLCHLVFFSGFTRLYNQVQGQAAKKSLFLHVINCHCNHISGKYVDREVGRKNLIAIKLSHKWTTQRELMAPELFWNSKHWSGRNIKKGSNIFLLFSFFLFVTAWITVFRRSLSISYNAISKWNPAIVIWFVNSIESCIERSIFFFFAPSL